MIGISLLGDTPIWLALQMIKGPSIDARAFGFVSLLRSFVSAVGLSLRMKLDDVELQFTVQVSPPLSSFCGSPLPFAIASMTCLFIAAS